MPLQSARALASQPVFCGVDKIGRTIRPWFNLDTGQVDGVFVQARHNVWLLPRDELALLEDGLRAHSPDSLQSLAPRTRPLLASQTPRHVLGAGVETQSGRRVGILKDALLTEPDWRLAQIVVHESAGDRLLSRDVIIELRHDRVIVADEVAVGRPLPWASLTNPVTLNPCTDLSAKTTPRPS